MGKRLWRLLILSSAVVLPVSIFLSILQGQQVHRNSFEGREPVWTKGASDAPVKEIIHNISEQTAHTGQFSEHIQLEAQQGQFIHYAYPVGKAPVSEELTISVWVKANRPGIQLQARLVLPKEPNPANIEDRLTTTLRGDIYQLAGRWQKLTVGRAVKLSREQQQLMRAEMKRDVDFTDSYIDTLMLNLYGGPGMAEVWIDDLEVGPLVEPSPFKTTNRPVKPDEGKPGAPVPRTPGRGTLVELNQDQLMVSSRRFFPKMIHYSDTPLKTLRDAGFNTLFLDQSASTTVMEEAMDLGFWLVPTLPVTATDQKLRARFTNADTLNQELNRLQQGDAVLFWDLGFGLAHEQAGQVGSAAQMIRAADLQRPISADVWDGFRGYSRTLDLFGVHRFPLMTGLEMQQYYQWLNQRRLLARPGAFMWTWVQTHLPEWYTTLIYDRLPAAGFEEPIGPQPEQIRLMTYIALAAGCRGVGFWSDRFLADTHQGRDRLLTLALLNQEMKLLEPLLLTADTPRWTETSSKDVKAAVLRTQQGVLVLPMWMGRGAQFVPGQSAAANLTIVVPEVPVGTQAWQVSPGEVRSLQSERVAGGTKVTIPEFGLTSAIVFSSDTTPTGVVVRFQDQVRRTAKMAAQWAHDLAEVEFDKVSKIHGQLEQAGHTFPDAKDLMENARLRLRASVEHFNNGDYRQAFAEAERTQRPLRILMRAHWEEAIRTLDTPVASPYAVSFFTLPRHWQFLNEIKQGTPGANTLADGNFEMGPERAPAAWTKQDMTLDEVDMLAQPVPDNPKEGRQCLHMEIKTKDPRLPPPQALERTYLGINSPPVQLPPGSLVKISGWVRIPKAIAASPDGAILYDNIGGEPLGVRLVGPLDWKEFTLYRRVPPSGMVRVTLALTGIGSVYFDDVRIQTITFTGPTPTPPSAN